MSWVLLGFAVFAAWTIDAAIGFGSLVIALAIGALFLPLDVIMPVLVPLNIILSGYLSVRYRQNIHWSLLLKKILPLMVIGGGVGLLSRTAFSADTLRILFGVVVVWFASRSLWFALQQTAKPRIHAPWFTLAITFFAGITHGLFASGGPLLVYALTGVKLAKQEFRATLSLVWFTLNSSLTLWFFVNGAAMVNAQKTLLLIPVVMAAIVFGEWLHHRISEVLFRKVVLFLLLFAGILLLVK